MLAGHIGRRRQITAVDANARAHGVSVGMAVAKTQALLPGLVIRDADPAADAEGLDRLALWALQRISPVVMPDPPDGLVIATRQAPTISTAASRPCWKPWCGNSLSPASRRARRSPTAGARLMPPPAFLADASWSCQKARRRRCCGRCRWRPCGSTATPSPACIPLGFETIGDLMGQPRAPLTLRFGTEIGRRLDQALDRVAEPVDPIRTHEQVEVRRVFCDPFHRGSSIPDPRGVLETRNPGSSYEHITRAQVKTRDFR